MLNCFRWIHFKDKRYQNHWLAFKTAEGQGGADLNLQIVSQTTLRWVCEKKRKSRLCCFLRLLLQWRTATDWQLCFLSSKALNYFLTLQITLSCFKLSAHALNCPLTLWIACSNKNSLMNSLLRMNQFETREWCLFIYRVIHKPQSKLIIALSLNPKILIYPITLYF